MKHLHLIAVSLLLSSCAVGPDYTAPDIPVKESWSSSQAHTAYIQQAAAQEAWWKGFKDNVLNQLIEEAAQHNHDVRTATTNVLKAKALRRESAGSLWPSLSGRTDAEKQGLSNRTTNNSNAGGAKERDNFSGSLDARWELDVFGGLRRELESSTAALEAAEELRRGVLLSVLAEVARNYFEVRGLQKRITILERNIALLKEIEALAETQFRLGVGTEFDVARARGEREAIEATVPNLEAALHSGVYRLSVLTGKSPEAHVSLLMAQQPLPAPPDTVPVGLRSELLQRRPDIRAAERTLAAKTADIGVATADLFPKFSLTGALGTSAQLFSDAFTSGAITYTLGQNISWSLFEGGALRARLAQAEAGAEEAAIAYEKTVLEAIEDAESALTHYGKEWQTLKRLKAAQKTRKEAFEIARLRYEGGEENFLVILDAERSLIAAEDDVIESETRILTSLTQLYKALGGGWKHFEETAPKNP